MVKAHYAAATSTFSINVHCRGGRKLRVGVLSVSPLWVVVECQIYF